MQLNHITYKYYAVGFIFIKYTFPLIWYLFTEHNNTGLSRFAVEI